MKWTACLAVLGTLGGAAGHAQQQQEPPASVLVRPLASLIIPGMGQLMAHQDRGAVYIAAEVYLLSRYLQLDHEATVEARRFQSLAFDVARQSFVPLRRDTIFEYYEQMERFAESGREDPDTGPQVGSENVPATYNGPRLMLCRSQL